MSGRLQSLAPGIARLLGRRMGIGAATLMLLAAGQPTATWATVPTGFSDTQVVGGLDEPVSLARVPDATASTPRVLLVEQRTARVRMSIGGAVTTLGTVPGVRSADTERGLLGIVVDPRFPASPYLYIHATDNRFGNLITISRFTLTGDLAYTGAGALAFDPLSRYDLIRNLPDNASNHNGGTVRFGPDGMLYVSLGDDANSCNAQQSGVLAGKILRLDVTRLPAAAGGPAPYASLSAAGNPFASSSDSLSRLVWALGFRNPFRFHIDAANGDLFVADVGENTWEELTRISAAGQNSGWPWREGPVAFSSCSGSQPAVVGPIASYNHDDGVVIISAGVYRRPASGATRFPAEYDGNCFYLDYYSGFMRRLTGSGSTWSAAAPVAGQPNSTDWANGFNDVSDVLALPDGSLLYVRQSIGGAGVSGEIRRIANAAALSVESAPAAAVSFAPPRPTPARGPVVLEWSQPTANTVGLTIFDASGRTVRVLDTNASFSAGRHVSEWDGRGDDGAHVAPGLYFARLRVGSVNHQARVVVVR